MSSSPTKILLRPRIQFQMDPDPIYFSAHWIAHMSICFELSFFTGVLRRRYTSFLTLMLTFLNEHCYTKGNTVAFGFSPHETGPGKANREGILSLIPAGITRSSEVMKIPLPPSFLADTTMSLSERFAVVMMTLLCLFLGFSFLQVLKLSVSPLLFFHFHTLTPTF